MLRGDDPEFLISQVLLWLVLQKLGCTSRLQIALNAFERGLAVPPQPPAPLG